MKFLVLLAITTLFAFSSSKSRYQLASIAENCSLILPVLKNSQSLVFDMNVDADLKLKNCIFKNCNSEQSVIALNTFYGPKIKFDCNNKRERIKTTDAPNGIILTKYLTLHMIESPLLKLFIGPHWPLLYIVVTSHNEFRCEDNKMNSDDFLLLEDIMNKLWHKFKIMRVGVAFPYACPQKMVIYNGKRMSHKKLYDRRIQLIDVTSSEELYDALMNSGNELAEDYPIRASIFFRYPTSITECKNLHYYMSFNLNLTGGFCGLDGLVMHDVLTHFKFNFYFPKNENCDNYGYAIPGNVSGSLGCIVRKELDLSFNARFMTLYSDESIYYLHYVKTDALCALVRKSDIIPLWHSAFNSFRPLVWLLITSVMVATGVMMWAADKIKKAMNSVNNNLTIWCYIQHAILSAMFGSTPMKVKSLLILRGSCLLTSILVGARYQGHINRVYTTLERFEKIQTLEQLYRSGATLYLSPSMKELTRQLSDPDDELQQNFFKRAGNMEGDRIGIILQRPFVTSLERKSDSVMTIFKQYADNDGHPLIDIVDECFYTYYLSYIARSGFPFFEDLQIFLQRLVEAGLPTMYYKWTQQMLNLPLKMPLDHNEPRPFSKIKLEDQRIAFGVLFFGHLLSFVVFVLEVWRGKLQRIKSNEVTH